MAYTPQMRVSTPLAVERIAVVRRSLADGWSATKLGSAKPTTVLATQVIHQIWTMLARSRGSSLACGSVRAVLAATMSSTICLGNQRLTTGQIQPPISQPRGRHADGAGLERAGGLRRHFPVVRTAHGDSLR